MTKRSGFAEYSFCNAAFHNFEETKKASAAIATDAFLNVCPACSGSFANAYFLLSLRCFLSNDSVIFPT